MAWTTPRTWVAGETVTAAIMNTHVRDNLKALGDPWTAYTPTYAGITAIGNAGVSARYIVPGKLVIVQVKITFGSTTTFGAGNITVSLPITPNTNGNQDVAYGSVFMKDTSAGIFKTGIPVVQSTGVVAFIEASGTVVTNTAPFTWAQTDILSFVCAYEAA